MITVQTTIPVDTAIAWEFWTTPYHIMQWNQASADWHTTAATNDVRVGGELAWTMAAKDGSFSFVFGGVYTAVEPQKHLAYTLGDGRKVTVDFVTTPEGTQIIERFDAESVNPPERQQAGWQAILDSYANYTVTASMRR